MIGPKTGKFLRMKFNNYREKVGDVFQILTSEGVCYGQVTHKHPTWKYLIGIFRDFRSKEPEDFNEYVNQIPQFVTPFLIGTAIQRGYFAVVANVPVAQENAKPITFRGTNNPGCGEKTIWWLIDESGERRLERPLTNEELRYPRDALISAPLLIEMIEKDYRVERDYL
jgi:hypothetical protein